MKKLGWCLGLLCLSACVKYSTEPSLSHPAYLRVFNDLNYAQGSGNSGLPSTEFTFLFDPVFDGSGLPTGGAVVGDYITVRSNFSASYPTGAGNIGITNQTEWPGSAPVLTAPTINGLDLSAWAQVASGKHRLMLVGRPQTDTPFARLPPSARNVIIADTTVDLTPGEVYTMEGLVFDEATERTGAYIRDENFTRTPFSTLNNYLSFYDLTAANLNMNNAAPPNSGGPGPAYFIPPLDLYYTIYTPICANTNATGVVSYNCSWPAPTVQHVYFRTITGVFQTGAPYDSLPQMPASEFLNPDGTVAALGNTPYVSIGVYEEFGASSSLNFGVSWGVGGPPPTIEQPVYAFTEGLPIATSNGQQVNIYPSISIIELVNGAPYVIQLHRTFDAPIITN